MEFSLKSLVKMILHLPGLIVLLALIILFVVMFLKQPELNDAQSEADMIALRLNDFLKEPGDFVMIPLTLDDPVNPKRAGETIDPDHYHSSYYLGVNEKNKPFLAVDYYYVFNYHDVIGEKNYDDSDWRKLKKKLIEKKQRMLSYKTTKIVKGKVDLNFDVCSNVISEKPCVAGGARFGQDVSIFTGLYYENLNILKSGKSTIIYDDWSYTNIPMDSIKRRDLYISETNALYFFVDSYGRIIMTAPNPEFKTLPKKVPSL